MSKSAEVRNKYEGFVSNLEWHIRTNKPKQEELDKIAEQCRIYNEIIYDLKRLESYASQPEGREELKKDPFIKKHLDIIWEKTREAKIEIYIKPMFDDLSSASIKYFIETGIINGGFREALMKMMDSVRNCSSLPPSKEQPEGREEWASRKEIIHDAAEMLKDAFGPQSSKREHKPPMTLREVMESEESLPGEGVEQAKNKFWELIGAWIAKSSDEGENPVTTDIDKFIESLAGASWDAGKKDAVEKAICSHCGDII